MTRLSNSQQELLRTRPHKTDLYLSVFQPRVVFKAQISDPGAYKGDRVILYSAVTQGSYLDIEAGMTLYIGSASGEKDIGKLRIRSATAGQIVVSENSNVNFQFGQHLTVVRYWELWPVFPRIVQSRPDVEDVVFLKDYDILYENQNSILGTFPCMGPDRAVFAGEQVYYSATGTFNPLGDTLSYYWFFEGGTPSGSTAETPGYISYPSTGHYTSRLIVSGSSGSGDVSYRCVSVYDRPGQGNNVPVQKWELLNLGGSRDEGGYRASFRVYEDAEISEDSVVVLFSEDWYGTTKQSVGGNSINNEKIFFVGRVMQGTIRYDYQKSYVEFTVGSLTEVMKNALGFSVSAESKSSPATWYELLDMDCRRALYHYLRWHTTVLNIADFQFLGDDYKIQFFDADRTSMFDAIDNLMRNTLMGKVVSDRQGKIWAEVDARAHLIPTGSYTSTMEITKRDWMGEPNIEERYSDSISYYEAGGIIYSGPTLGTFSAALAAAPGLSPSFRGRIEMPEGLALLSQVQLNWLVGHVFANENSRHPKINLETVGNYRNFDIAPQESVTMNIAQEDTVSGIQINGLYIPESIEWEYDPIQKTLIAKPVDFRNLVSGMVGETVEIAASPTDAGLDTGFSVPQLQIPPLPILTVPPSVAGMSTGSSCCDYFSNLGLGMGVFSGVFIRESEINNASMAQQNFGYDYASNPAMYDTTTGQIALLNSGTITYEIEVRADWRQLQSPIPPHSVPGSLSSVLSVGVFGSYFNMSVGQPEYNGAGLVSVVSSGVGDSGTIILSHTFNESSLKKPYKISSYVEETYGPHNFNLVGWSNIKVTIRGTP